MPSNSIAKHPNSIAAVAVIAIAVANIGYAESSTKIAGNGTNLPETTVSAELVGDHAVTVSVRLDERIKVYLSESPWLPNQGSWKGLRLRLNGLEDLRSDKSDHVAIQIYLDVPASESRLSPDLPNFVGAIPLSGEGYESESGQSNLVDLTPTIRRLKATQPNLGKGVLKITLRAVPLVDGGDAKSIDVKVRKLALSLIK